MVASPHPMAACLVTVRANRRGVQTITQWPEGGTISDMTATPLPYAQPQPVPWQRREDILTAHCARAARSGWRVTQRGHATATLNGPMVHIPIWVTLILLLPTLGLWAIPARMCARRGRWQHVHVDEWGRVHVETVARGMR